MKRRLCTLIAVLWCLSALSDGFFCRVRNFAADNGMLQAHISNAQQDKMGLMWYATWNGLVRFDGYSFNTFKPILSSDGTIFSNRIYNIKMTATDNLWCVSSDNRLYLFDRYTNHFTDVQKALPTLNDKKVKVLTPLKKGVTWVTFRDFSCLRLHDGNFQKGYTYWSAGCKALLGSKKILDIVQDAGGDEWVLTDRGAVCFTRNAHTTKPFRYVQRIGDKVFLLHTDGSMAVFDRRQQFHYSSLNEREDEVHYVTSTPTSLVLGTEKGVTIYQVATKQKTTHSIGKIIYLYIDSRKRIWAFSNTNVVWLISADGKTVRELSATPLAESMPLKNPQLIFENADHQIIVKPEKGSLSYYDEKEQQLKDCRFYQNNEATTFSPSEISKYLIDHQGNLWLFQKHAAYCISFYPDLFTHWENPSKTEVRAMLRDNLGRNWLSDGSNALYIMKGIGMSPVYLSSSGQLSQQPATFTQQPVYCLTEDGQHRIWVGTKGDGVYLLTPTNESRTAYRTEHFQHQVHDSQSLHSDTIWNVLQDTRGDIWLSSYEQGLSRASLRDGKWVFRQVKGLPNDVKIRCLMEVKPGILLIGTTTGLLTADFRHSDKPVCYQNGFRQEEWGLKGNDVMRIVRCCNRYYVCVFGSGISEILSDNLLSNKLHFRNYLLPPNATADQIKTAVSDGKNIWIASSQAIVRFAAETGNYTVYDRSNFIGTFNFSEGAPIIADSLIIAGTTDGVLTFASNTIALRKSSAHIAFTGIQYQNDMNIRPLNDIETLIIAPDERSFSLYLSSLNYDDAADISFRYMLEGYDNGWNYTGENQHAVIYNNLPPGDYTLEVQAIGDNGIWDESCRTITIHVTPRFVETVWFRLLMLFLLIALFLGMAYAIVYLSRMRRLLQRKYSLLMTVDEFSHDIRIEKEQKDNNNEEQLFLKKTIAFFEDNISNSNFVIEDLARHLGMSRTAYYNKMKSITGLSPVDFIKQMRIKKALKLMEDTSLSITDIAYKVGFSDPKYFSRCFKAEMGMTPTQYANKSTKR